MDQPDDDLARADAEVAARTRWFTRPVRGLVNAPHLLVVAITTIWVSCSLLYALLEDKGPIEGLWWGIVTGSTVGYGDYYPATTAGRAIAVVLIVSMLVLVPIAIGHVIANLVLDRNQFTHDEQVALAATIESVHERLDRLEHLTMASLAEAHGEAWVHEQVRRHAEADMSTEDVSEQMLHLFARAED